MVIEKNIHFRDACLSLRVTVRWAATSLLCGRSFCAQTMAQSTSHEHRREQAQLLPMRLAVDA
jgi:hypothetical protein